MPTLSGLLAALEQGIVQREEMPSAHSRVLQTLAAEDLLATLDPHPRTADAFLATLFAICDYWVEGIFRSPFWDAFHRGQASRTQVMQFLAQLYHRTVGADHHNLIAAERCGDPEVRDLLERHYREEFGHAAILLKGFAKCGLARDGAVVHGPLRSTRRLIDYMVDISSDTMAYLGCYGIFHAPSTVRGEEQLVHQFERFAALYPFATPAFDAVCQHARLDCKLGHAEIALERLVRSRGCPDAEGVRSALRGARGAAAAFRAIFDDLSAIAEE
ncbi:hypothetical protein EER27_12630 [Lysobacter psychrotolerans]|uniref:Iron-containing redox enzyme family protein n=1 Tax=Montanilutibacter psychrotolerans TaxID=1327343 RepID=A0A3M8SPV0_9GAMM|nr:hypothetical protein EER27_12630 [Lysobacter psychrotolerans]